MPFPRSITVNSTSLLSFMAMIYTAMTMPISMANEVQYYKALDPDFPTGSSSSSSKIQIPLTGETLNKTKVVTALHSITDNNGNTFFSQCFNFNELVNDLRPAVNLMSNLLPVNYTEAACEVYKTLTQSGQSGPSVKFRATVYGLNATTCENFEENYGQTVKDCADEYNQSHRVTAIITVAFVGFLMVGFMVGTTYATRAPERVLFNNPNNPNNPDERPTEDTAENNYRRLEP